MCVYLYVYIFINMNRGNISTYINVYISTYICVLLCFSQNSLPIYKICSQPLLNPSNVDIGGYRYWIYPQEIFSELILRSS